MLFLVLQNNVCIYFLIASKHYITQSIKRLQSLRIFYIASHNFWKMSCQDLQCYLLLWRIISKFVQWFYKPLQSLKKKSTSPRRLKNLSLLFQVASCDILSVHLFSLLTFIYLLLTRHYFRLWLLWGKGLLKFSCMFLNPNNILFQKLIWPFTVQINCSSDRKISPSASNFWSQKVRTILKTKYHCQRWNCHCNWDCSKDLSRDLGNFSYTIVTAF